MRVLRASITRRNLSIILLVVLLCAPVVAAGPLSYDGIDTFDQVLINSQDWKVNYQGLLFAKLVGVPGDFIAEPKLATQIVESLPLSEPRILLIESAGKKQYEGVDRLLAQKGFTVINLPGSDIPMELVSSITPKQIIVLDERYPYNCISVAPYAILTDSFVMFADAQNIDDVVSVIEEKDAAVMQYGLIDSAVSTELSQFNPKIIDEGGKFDNNIRIIEEFRKIRPDTQVVMTNGEFLEVGLVDDFNPILFVGRSKVPVQVEEFFATTNVSYGVVVGNYLSSLIQGFGTVLEDRYDKETFFVVRFAKSPRIIDDQFNKPQALEYFSLPILSPELVISTISYNRLMKTLEVTYTNPSQIPVFFTASFAIRNGDQSYSAGDDEVQSIAPGQLKTKLYDIDIENPVGLSGEGIFLYGDYPSSLEFELSQDFDDIPIVDIADDSLIEIESLLYDKYDKAFYIVIKNPSDVATYANVELVDVIVDGVPTTIGTKKIASLQPGESKEVFIRASLSDLDVIENEQVLVRSIYGQRERVLFKETQKMMDLQVRLIKPGYLVAGAAVLIIIFLIIFFAVMRRKEYVCDRCNHRMKSRVKPGRHSCGGKFRKY